MVNIDDDVAVLTEQIDALEKLGQREDVDKEEVYDLSIRWGTALAGRLPRLVHYSSLGQLDEADERRFHMLCGQLRELSQLVDRFELAHPQFSIARVSGPRHAKQRKRSARL
jgi:hypothetical protein